MVLGYFPKSRKLKCCIPNRDSAPAAPPSATQMVSAKVTMAEAHMRWSVGVGELVEEPHVVLREQAQVVDAIFQVGYALHSHPEGVSAVNF